MYENVLAKINPSLYILIMRWVTNQRPGGAGRGAGRARGGAGRVVAIGIIVQIELVLVPPEMLVYCRDAGFP
jgi:hypothetical protein